MLRRLMRDFDTNEELMDVYFADVPRPAEAIECGPWRKRGEQDFRRGFLVKEWDVAGIWVSVAGEQDHRGKVTRWVHVGGDDRCAASDRRQLIAALTNAGHLLDSLSLRQTA
jgi:hypothetical protein